MLKVFALVFLSAVSCFAFEAAQPVWLDGRPEGEMNRTAGFRTTFTARPGKDLTLRIAGSNVYRIFLNGEFFGYGPARGPHGFDRVDEWALRARPGKNTLAVEVGGYNIKSFYLLAQPPYLQAEVVSGKDVLASTGKNFEATLLTQRVQKVHRFSFQRPFAEVYNTTPDADAWRTGGAMVSEKLAARPQLPLIERGAPYPAFDLRRPVKEVSTGSVVKEVTDKKPWSPRTVNGEWYWPGYPVRELEANPFYEIQQIKVTERKPSNLALCSETALSIGANRFSLLDFAQNDTGFIGATVTCSAPTRLFLIFGEILFDGDVSALHGGDCNMVVYNLTRPGTYRLETFDPYTFRYLKLMTLDGACEVSGVYLREYVNSTTGRAAFNASDPALNRLFEAARETFKQNAVDLFTDCPGRERAVWLCDSFFTARAAFDLCGNTAQERMLFQNYLLPKKFPGLPEGMIPKCYPADYNNNFIPNWAMWFVVELEEYLRRSGDREMIDALRPRVLALIEFLDGYRNSDGLLEKLPSWVFIEWSRANDLVQDVSYPSNMTYAEVLSIAGRLYNLPERLAQAEALRAKIREQSFDGAFFVDNAKRQPDGTLKLTGQRTEACQYYAFFFNTATPQSHPELWKKLRDEFGPGRHQTKRYPDVAFANAFIGNYLRLEILSRNGQNAKILKETKDYFLKMADRTGTLWEHDNTSASCCHGFASHIVRVLNRDVLGVAAVDPVSKTVRLRFADLPLESCSGTLPVGDALLKLSWKREGKTLRYALTLPPGFTLASAQAEPGLKLVRK